VIALPLKNILANSREFSERQPLTLQKKNNDPDGSVVCFSRNVVGRPTAYGRSIDEATSMGDGKILWKSLHSLLSLSLLRMTLHLPASRQMNF